MKKIFIALTFIFSILCFNLSFAQEFFGLGIELIKDPYNNKVFIFKILNNSSAQKNGLLEGSEVISIDGKKVKNLDIKTITNLIRGKKDTKVKLTVKYNKKQSDILIPRTLIKQSFKTQNKFELCWEKIAPDDIIIESIPQNMLNNMSKDLYIEIVPIVNYWISRKASFQYSYNSCMMHPKAQQEKCISTLINQEINKTQKEDKFKLKYDILKEQSLQNSVSLTKNNYLEGL